ncbi:MAG: hypothetical protein ACF8MJ_10200 [Phycisphaerales bacterium JB050]
MAKSIAKASALIAGVAGGAMAVYVKRSMAAIDATAKFADRIGIAVDELTKLRLAAELTGVQASALDMGLQRMTRRIAEAARGTGEAVDALRALGLDAQALAAMSPDEQFRAIAEAMSRVESQGERVRLAFKLFDSEGVALVNTLALGADGLDEVGRKADALGISFSRVDAAAVERANDAITFLKRAIDGVSNSIAIALAPHLERSAKALTDWAGKGDNVAKVGVFIAKSFVVVKAAANDLVRGFQFLYEAAKVAILFIAESVTGLVSVVAGASTSVLEFLGISAGGLKDFAETARAMSASLQDQTDQAAESLANLATSARNDGLLSIAEQFEKIDAAARKATRATEEFSEVTPPDLSAFDEFSKKFEDLKRFAEQLIDATRTPLERFEKQLVRIEEAFREGLIDEETYRRAIEKAKSELADATAPDTAGATTPRTADFQQIDLSRIAIGGVDSASPRPLEIKSAAIDQLLNYVEQIAVNGAPARMAGG